MWQNMQKMTSDKSELDLSIWENEIFPQAVLTSERISRGPNN